tara:strand:+ start:110 stop:1204 length:1095 start_codon:yes stop_codon:yes gene_type:complete
MAEPELSNEQLFESTKDVLSEAFDQMHKEGDGVEEDELDLNTPTFDEAQDEQKVEEEPKAEVKDSPDEKSPEEPEPEVKAEEKKEETAEVELSDEEILNNLKPKAQERFKDLVSRSKELEDRISQLEPSEAVASHVLSSGTQPDQLNFALDVFRSLNSGDWEQARSALNRIDEFSNMLAERLGVSDQSSNEKSSYSDFEDLSGAVENLEMSEEWANKLANQRVSANSINQSKQEFSRQTEENYQQQQAFSQEQERAYNEIKNWEESVKTSDADFDSKRDIMLDIGEKIANSGVNPNNWLPLLKNEYEVLSRGMSLASKRTNASKSSGPLAPSSSSSGNVDSADLKQAEITPEFLQYHLDQLHNR